MTCVMRARAALGILTLAWASGVYHIVAGADALLSPLSQAKIVEVLPVGPTQVRLEFDTGIR